ncbi:hypothetical protein PoB_006486900 [Plakobranchus ocellatus]|uniref:Uncharacterized protein n=1 Tax=Plakobranchus ocellatus TaxID=259542 RepID=A0AAV4D2D6_9GAST|nr:hypothetical protein PoB_006486900 [Plakobranchus ocellatus]
MRVPTEERHGGIAPDQLINPQQEDPEYKDYYAEAVPLREIDAETVRCSRGGLEQSRDAIHVRLHEGSPPLPVDQAESNDTRPSDM